MLIWRGEAALYQFEVIERYHPFLAGKSYGILAKTCDGCIPQELVLIPNISHDRKWVARLAKACNQNQPGVMDLLEMCIRDRCVGDRLFAQGRVRNLKDTKAF